MLRNSNRAFARICLSVLSTAALANAQEPADTLPDPPHSAKTPPGFVGQATRNAMASCWEPPPFPGIKDYAGPMKKAVGLFAPYLERNSVQPPRYKPGGILCSLTARGKFVLFVKNSIDPVTFLGSGFKAGIDQASNADATFGKGTSGYSKRFGAAVADRVSTRLFKDFAYPSIFSEDPRYYPLGTGSTRRRLLHAAEHLFIAHHSSDGTLMFNYSEWLGTSSAAALSNLYHPGQDRGAGAMARETASRFAWDVGFDALREFWPEITRKFRLPFRDNSHTTGPPAIGDTH